MTFREAATSIATNGFEGCIGLIIATKKGALVGHFTQTDRGYNIANTRFRELYGLHRRSLAGAVPIVYAQVDAGEVNWIFPEMVARFTDLVQELTGTQARMSYLEPLETWVDEDGMPLDDVDYDNYQSGGLVLENRGGGHANTDLTIITCRIQRHGMQPN